jgi:hypothetical protein
MAAVKGSFHFYHCRTIPQVLEGEGEKQLAEVSVGIVVNRIKHGPYSIPIRQVKTYEDPLQIDRPKGYEGPIDEAAFRRMTEQYFRGFVDGAGAKIDYPNGKLRFHLRDHTFRMLLEADFAAADPRLNDL